MHMDGTPVGVIVGCGHVDLGKPGVAAVGGGLHAGESLDLYICQRFGAGLLDVEGHIRVGFPCIRRLVQRHPS